MVPPLPALRKFYGATSPPEASIVELSILAVLSASMKMIPPPAPF